MTNSAPRESIRVLLSEIIDYAGLFPPSEVSMAEAVLNYATYKNSNFNWMLGRFVVPVSRLDEFWDAAGDFVSRDANGWRLSVLAGEDIYDTIRKTDDFNAQHSPFVFCDTLEVRATTESKIENTVDALPEYITAYFEIPNNERLGDLVATLAFLGQRAKLRTGGVTADAFPRPQEIIRFIRTCLAANVPFKATAGLHHPLRCFRPLTYAPNAPQGTMHGFLNMFLTVGYVREGYEALILEEILEDEFEEGFEFDDDGVTWHNDYALNIDQLARLRRENIISFGSCSFDEPIADLQQIGLL